MAEGQKSSGVEAWFAAWATRDFDALAAMYHPDAELVRPDGHSRGVREIVAYLRAVADADPGRTARIDRVAGTGAAVIVEWTETHTARPDNAVEEDAVVDIFDIAAGRIAAQREYLDPARRLRLLAQLSTRAGIGHAPAQPPPDATAGATVIAAAPPPAPPTAPADAGEDRPELWTASGPDRGLRYPLGLPEVSVGRALDNNLVLRDPSASSHHARFERLADGLYILDLKSTNGTHVNGSRVERRRLQNGDRVTIGENVFVVEWPVGAPNPAA